MQLIAWLESFRRFPVTRYLVIALVLLHLLDLIFFPHISPMDCRNKDLLMKPWSLVTAGILDRNLLKVILTAAMKAKPESKTIGE